jgi:ABC-type lipoprotein release transport system permease subunit
VAIAAFALGRVVNSVIYGVSSRDVATFVSATVLIVLVSLAASLIPALRATRVDPFTIAARGVNVRNQPEKN